MFLSTPPSRVATLPLAPFYAQLERFYPRHPRGWRLLAIARRLTGKSVSIHATLAGGDCTQPTPEEAHC